MAIYETIFILDSLMPPKEIDTTVERYTGIISSNGGSVRKVDKWGKKRLAYEIQKKQYGFYVAIEFEGTGQIPRELESDYNYNDKVLRYMTYHYDKRKLNQLAAEAAENEAMQKPKPEPAPAAPKPEPVEEKVEEKQPEEAKAGEETLENSETSEPTEKSEE